MALGEVHFLGFDPTQGLEQLKGCPILDPATTIVWFEKWFFTAVQIRTYSTTGIFYVHCYASFDAVGNVISLDPIGGAPCCGFAATETATPTYTPPTPDEWLAKAREACAPVGLPPPGTIQLAPKFREIYGVPA